MLQSAPDTILYEVAAVDDSTLEISALGDNTVAYRGTIVEGTPETIVAKQLVMTITRRAATSQNGATKYTIKLVHPVYNITGQLQANMLISMDVVVPLQYLASPEHKMSGVMQAASAILGSDLFANMAADGSFLR